VGVLLGNGDGTFKPAALYNSGGSNALSVVVADVNGDGNPDLVVPDCVPSGSSCAHVNRTVGILLGKGDGTFRAAVTYDYGVMLRNQSRVADVNGDASFRPGPRPSDFEKWSWGVWRTCNQEPST
jgi:hypothetical protein